MISEKEMRKVINDFRKEMGDSVIKMQDSLKAGGKTPEEVIPEIIGSILSLAAFIAHTNAELTGLNFVAIALRAAEMEWKP